MFRNFKTAISISRWLSGIGHTYSGGLVQARLSFSFPQVMDLEQLSLTPPMPNVHRPCLQATPISRESAVHRVKKFYSTVLVHLDFATHVCLFVSAGYCRRMNRRNMLECWCTPVCTYHIESYLIIILSDYRSSSRKVIHGVARP